MNLALNPFDKGKKPEKVDDLVVDGADIIKRHVNFYNNLEFDTPKGSYEWYVMRHASRLEPLSPGQIEVLVRCLNPEYLGTYVAGIFLSSVIQNSFDAGYNHFELNLEKHRLHNLGDHLQGWYQKHLSLVVNGNVGHYFANHAFAVDFTVNGYIDNYFSMHANQCNFVLSGSLVLPLYTEIVACAHAHSCTYKVKDDTLYDIILEQIRFRSCEVEAI